MNGWGYEVIRFFGPSVGFSVWIIATDEAGYGPKLGPMVVAATLWRTSSDISAVDLASNDHRQSDVASPFSDSKQADAGSPSLRKWIGDSKQIFVPGKSLRPLVMAATAALIASECRESNDQVPESFDADRVLHWALSGANPATRRSGRSASQTKPTTRPFWESHIDPPVFAEDGEEFVHELADRLRSGEPRLMAVDARVLTAESFNANCDRQGNKANVAAEQTLGLVRTMLERRQSIVAEGRDHPASAMVDERDRESTCIVCDRLGGRRYYSAPILMHLDLAPSIVCESAQNSVYRWDDAIGEVALSFRVGGDSFVPVGLASMIAKTVRELSMRRFNRFFATMAARHGHEAPKPTAGYPQDAKRFYESVAELCREADLQPHQVWRDR